jgi:uncharacterized protein (TIGR03437 family)
MRSLFLIPLAVSVATLYGADFTTYIGDQNQYQVAALATDSAGNTYVTGRRIIQPPAGESTDDVFVTKLDVGGHIVFITTFGGKATDQGYAIALDSAGNIWVGGSTSSENFPLHDALEIFASGQGFLVKLAPDGTVIYSSYFGGVVNGIALDQSGNVYLTGLTNSKAFPTTSGLPNDTGFLSAVGIGTASGAFITKLDPTGSNVIYSAVIAGTAVDCGSGSSCFLSSRVIAGVGIALDSAGDALIAGNANVTDLPITAGAVAGYGAFAAKVNTAGNKMIYLTYVGPPAGDPEIYGPPQTITANGIAADAAGNAYVTGSTNDTNFPATPGAYQTKLNADLTQLYPNSNAFAVKLNPAGAVAWGTYLGGPTNGVGHAITLDGSGDVWLVGSNVMAAMQDSLSELSSDGSKLLYSANFASATAGQTLAVDQAGVVHLAGTAGLVSTITPGQTPASRIFGIMNAAAGPVSGRIAPGEVISIFGFGLGPTSAVAATPSGEQFPTTLGGVQVLVNGTAIPLLYVSASQINAEIPAPLNGVENDGAVIQVTNGSAKLPDFRVQVDQTIFGVFQSAGGAIAAINQDGTLNSASNPAKAGTIVSIWATGFLNFGVTADGAVSTAADNWCSYCQVSVGATTETVAYEGAAPGLIDGVMQINFMVPTQKGATQLQVFFDGVVYGFIYASE